MGRIFVREISRWQRGGARLSDPELPPEGSKLHAGAICYPQRFGGSLNLNVHFHVVVPDAVFALGNDGSRAVPLEHAPSTPLDLAEIVQSTKSRVLAWLERKGYLRGDEDPDEAEQPASALQACLHAGVRVAAGATESRGRLLRYCARSALSLERLSPLDGGRIAYRVQHGNAVRIMTPMQFMARLAALIPPPRHPLIQFHGVFAPHSKARARVRLTRRQAHTLFVRRKDRSPRARAPGHAMLAKPHMKKDVFAILYARDLPRSIRFYRDLLGMIETFRFPDEGEPAYVTLEWGGASLGIGTYDVTPGLEARDLRQPKEGRGFELCIYVVDVDSTVARLQTEGVPVVVPPVDQPWGERLAYVQDPEGNAIMLTSAVTGS